MKNNKGFSLVELIIVIAIMAILAASIAPALIRYIDKSRKSNDVTSAGTIKTAVETAIANETAYQEMIDAMGTADSSKVLTVSNATLTPFSTSGRFSQEVSDNLSTIPKAKYTKDGYTTFNVFVTKKGVVSVYKSSTAAGSECELQPSINVEYQ